MRNGKQARNSAVFENIKRDFNSDVYTIFSRNLIYNMDHMRISCAEPSSVILDQTE